MTGTICPAVTVKDPCRVGSKRLSLRGSRTTAATATSWFLGRRMGISGGEVVSNPSRQILGTRVRWGVVRSLPLERLLLQTQWATS